MPRFIYPTVTLGLSAIGIGLHTVLVSPAIASSLDRVQQTAAQITVKIEAERPSSGVLINRKGNLYTVLTTKHGVQVEDRYSIVTPDGQRYPVEWRSIQPLPNLDLALIQFKSDRTYSLAPLANYSPKPGQPLFLAGFPRDPVLQDSPRLGQTPRLGSLTPGSTIAPDQAIAWTADPVSQGYRLFYTNLAQAGMSGGAILDAAGRVVGIHGRSEGEEVQDSNGQALRLRLGYSSGIPIRTLLLHQPRLGLQTTSTRPAGLNPVDQATVSQWAKTLSTAPSEPTNAIAWANHANTLYRLGRLPEALSALDRALALEFTSASLWYSQGTILHTLGRYQEAVNSFDRASQLQPKLARAWQGKAIALLALNRPVEAIGALDQVLQVDAKSYIALYLRAQVLSHRLQQNQAALADCDRVLQLQPDFPEAWFLKGQVLKKLGRNPEAKRAIDEGLKLAPL